jgi:hypothetical protein
VVQVEGDGPLVPGEGRPEQALLAVRGLHAASGVTGAGQLDLEDVRAHVAEQRGGERGSEDVADVEHTHAGEGAGGHPSSCGGGGADHGRPFVRGLTGEGALPLAASSIWK